MPAIAPLERPLERSLEELSDKVTLESERGYVSENAKEDIFLTSKISIVFVVVVSFVKPNRINKLVLSTRTADGIFLKFKK